MRREQAAWDDPPTLWPQSYRPSHWAAALTLIIVLTSGPAHGQVGTSPPFFCGKTYVFSKALPDANFVSGLPGTIDVETYHFLDLVELPGNCPPPPHSVSMTATLNCTPAPSLGPFNFGPFNLPEDVKTVIPIQISLPAGPARVCDLIITSTVTLSDGTQFSQTGDQQISVIDPFSGNPNSPVVQLQPLAGTTQMSHPSDGVVQTYRLTNNHVLAYTGILTVDLRNAAGRPTNLIGPDNSGTGLYSLLDPGGANNPPAEFTDMIPPEDCVVLDHTIAISSSSITKDIFLQPGQTIDVSYTTRFWQLTPDGAAAECSAQLTGAHSDATAATAVGGTTYVCDHSTPPTFACPGDSGRACTAVADTTAAGPAAGLVGDASPAGTQPFQVNFALDRANMNLIVNGVPISDGTTEFSGVIHVDGQLISRNDEWSFIVPRAPPDAVIELVATIDVVPDELSLGNETIIGVIEPVAGLPNGFADKNPYAKGCVYVFGGAGFDPAVLEFIQQFSAVGVETVTFSQVAMTNLGVEIEIISPTRYVVRTTWTATNPGVRNLIGFDVVNDYRGFARPRRMCGTVPGDVSGDGVVNGHDVPSYVQCLLADSPGCECADMDFNEAVDDRDTGTFIAALLGTSELYSTPLGPLSAYVNTDAGDQPATVEGHLKFTASPPNAQGVRMLAVEQWAWGTSSAATLAGDTGGMTFLPRTGTVMGTWDLLRGRFDLAGDFDVGYPLAHEGDPPAPLEPSGEEHNDVLVSPDEFWTAFITAAAGVDVAGDINLDGELTADVVQSITGRVNQVKVPIEGFLVPRKTLGPPGCPIEHRCNRRVLCIQPVFFNDDDGTNPTGSSLAALQAAADSIWDRCCIEFDWRNPVFVNESDFKIIDDYVTPQGNSKILQLVSSHDVSASNGCVEVFFVTDIFIANPIRDAMGMSVFPGELDTRIIVADALIDVCDPQNVNTLAHELGHAMGNENHTDDGCLMNPQPGGPEPACPWYSPDRVSLDLCLSLRNPLLKEQNPKTACCKNPNCD